LHTQTHFFSFSHKHTLSSSNTCCLYPSSHFTRFFSLFLSHLIYLTLSLSRLISLFFSRLLSLTLSLSLSYLRLITLSLFYQFSLSHTHTHFLPFTCYLLPSFPFPRFLPLSLSVRAKKTAVAEPQQRAQALPTWRDQRHEKKSRRRKTRRQRLGIGTHQAQQKQTDLSKVFLFQGVLSFVSSSSSLSSAYVGPTLVSRRSQVVKITSKMTDGRQ